ncbi:hypothetical protein L1887_38715 [Cichorium endivia]|nr:hypothetical protein L1887_38715 [Cichorium endivia]
MADLQLWDMEGEVKSIQKAMGVRVYLSFDCAGFNNTMTMKRTQALDHDGEAGGAFRDQIQNNGKGLEVEFDHIAIETLMIAIGSTQIKAQRRARRMPTNILSILETT